jgi:DNA polymerase-4
MDAFYTSVEQLDNPELKGKCVMVGGTSNRGVVSAASYEARKLGVHSAMPAFQARQKCPDGIFLHPRMERYQEVSRRIMAILRDFSPLVETVSIDEAYLDISGSRRLYGDPVEAARLIKQKIKETVGLTSSVGLAPNKFLAKIASDMDKPDGLTVIMPEQVAQFIDVLPIQKVAGVGKKTAGQLTLLGINTLGDIHKFPENMLLERLGKFGRRLVQLAAGIDHTPVTPHTPPKSISTEHTLAENTRDKQLLKHHLLKQSEEVARQLRKAGVRAKTITLKVKFADFTLVTRRITLPAPAQSSETIYLHVAKLLDAYKLPQPLRLIGVGTSGFKAGSMPVQLDLFDQVKEKGENWEKVDQAVENIAEKFGRDAIKRASLSDK